MGSEPLGAVVVGTGFGVLTHLRAMRAAGMEVLALVGRDPDKAADRARRFGVAHATTVLDDALCLPGVDAVAVATPPRTHAEIVLDAIHASSAAGGDWTAVGAPDKNNRRRGTKDESELEPDDGGATFRPIP